MTIQHIGSGPSRRAFLGGLGMAGLSIPLLSSCTAGSGNELGQVDFNPPSDYRGREMNVVMWSAMGGSNGDLVQELITEFNDSQDDIYAEVQYQGSYEESGPALTAGLQAGTAPDLVMLADTWWPRYLLSDVLEPMDDYFTDEYNGDAYVGQVFEEGIVGGSTYWISFGRSTPLFYYNKDLFNEAGLPDRGPETWTELREWAAELNQIQVAGQSLPAHAFNAGDDWMFLAMIWQFGGRISEGLDIQIDGEGAVAAGEWAQRFIFEDNYAYMANSPNTDFGAGTVATIVGSTGSLQGIYSEADFEVGADFLPTEVTHGVPTGGNGFSMFRDTPAERKEAAFEVLKFLGRPDIAARWSLGTGYLPVVTASREEPELAAVLADDPNFDRATEQLAIAEPTDAVRQLVTDSTGTIISGLQEIMSSGSTDVQGTFDDVAAQLRAGADEAREDFEHWYE